MGLNTSIDLMGQVYGLKQIDDYTFFSVRDDGLKVFDISDIENPQQTFFYRNFDVIVDLVLKENLLFCISTEEVFIFNIDDPAQPELMDQFSIEGSSYQRHGAISDSWLLIATRWGGLEIYDISDISDPRLVGFYSDHWNIGDLAISETYAFILTDERMHVLDFQEVTSVSDIETSTPSHLNIHTIYPNPFNSRVTISYSLPTPGSVTLSIYNTRGQLVDVLVDRVMPAGSHSVVWEADDASAGVYLVWMGEQVRKVVFTK